MLTLKDVGRETKAKKLNFKRLESLQKKETLDSMIPAKSAVSCGLPLAKCMLFLNRLE